MADNQVITELVVDASGAQTGAQQYSTAMDQIASKSDSATASAATVQQAIDNQTVSFTKNAPSIGSVQAAWDRLSASLDPNVKMQQQLQKATDTITASQQRGIISQVQASAALDAATAKYSTASAMSAGLSEATGAVTRQMVAMAAGVGPVGIFLSALGPWGLAAAVGLGAAGEALSFMFTSANQMGAWASELGNTAKTIGINTDQLQALDNVAALSGVSADRMAMAYERFGVNLASLKQGTGTLYTDLEKINPALVQQLSTTTSVATAWDLVAQAYAGANTAQQALIARAAFGLGGAPLGNVLLATANAGGIGPEVTQQQQQNNLIPPEQIQQWKDLSEQINLTTTLAQRNMASIFTTQVLEAELSFVTQFKEFSDTARNFGMSGALSQLLSNKASLLNVIPGAGPILSAAGAGIGALGKWYTGQTSAPEPPAPLPPEASSASFGSSFGYGMPGGSPGVQAAQIKQQIQILGDAATAYDKLAERLANLKVFQDQDTQGVNANDIARATAVAQLDAQMQVLQGLVSALGPMASTNLLVQAAEAKVNDETAKGIPITASQKAALLDLAAARANGTLAIQQQTDALNIQAQTYALPTGAADALKAVLDELSKAQLDHKQLTNDDLQAVSAWAANLGNAAEAAARAKIALDAAYAGKQALFTDQDVQIAQQLKTLYGNDIPAALASAEAAQLQFNQNLKDARTYSTDFANSFVQAIQQGKNGFEALSAAAVTTANSIASQFAKLGAQNIFGGIVSGSVSQIGSGVGSFGIGTAISVITGWIGAFEQAQKAWDQAQQTWANEQPQFAQFEASLTGSGGGSLTSALNQAQQQTQQYADTAQAAGQATTQLSADLATYATTQIRQFTASFDVMITSLSGGLGFNSPAIAAAQNIQQIGTQLTAFIADTQNAVTMTGAVTTATSAAQSASQTYALSLLQTPPALDAVQTALATLDGNAAQLQSTLQDLGMSASAAATAISNDTTTALGKIKNTFQAGLVSQIFSATPNLGGISGTMDWVNQIQTLVTQRITNLADAQATGGSAALVQAAFVAQV